MKERPILFSAPMVQAILAGNKTQTRRVIKNADNYKDWNCVKRALDSDYLKNQLPGATESTFVLQENDGELVDLKWQPISCQYGEVGDQLWVRETFGDKVRRLGDGSTHESYAYRASEPDCIYAYEASGNHIKTKWTPSIHMPRKASRITLEITNIRVERLQDISEDDAKEEGVIPCEKGGVVRCHSWAFKYLWQSIYGDDSWNSNPWVWVIEFKQVIE